MRMMLLQPFYFPWIGMFDMMSRVDLFVVYDDAQYSSGGWQSRNRIRNANGVHWLSLGIDRKQPLATQIREKKLKNDTGWARRNLSQLQDAYAACPFFDEFFAPVRGLLESRTDSLLAMNVGSIRLCADYLGIRTPLEYASNLSVDPGLRGADRVVALCKAAGASQYLDGASGRDIYDKALFSRNGVEILFHKYDHPVYRQPFNDFHSHLSILDLIFNEGKSSLEILRSGNGNRFELE